MGKNSSHVLATVLATWKFKECRNQLDSSFSHTQLLNSWPQFPLFLSGFYNCIALPWLLRALKKYFFPKTLIIRPHAPAAKSASLETQAWICSVQSIGPGAVALTTRLERKQWTSLSNQKRDTNTCKISKFTSQKQFLDLHHPSPLKCLMVYPNVIVKQPIDFFSSSLH